MCVRELDVPRPEPGSQRPQIFRMSTLLRAAGFGSKGGNDFYSRPAKGHSRSACKTKPNRTGPKPLWPRLHSASPLCPPAGHRCLCSRQRTSADSLTQQTLTDRHASPSSRCSCDFGYTGRRTCQFPLSGRSEYVK